LVYISGRLRLRFSDTLSFSELIDQAGTGPHLRHQGFSLISRKNAKIELPERQSLSE
jgi:hypothetical protein